MEVALNGDIEYRVLVSVLMKNTLYFEYGLRPEYFRYINGPKLHELITRPDGLTFSEWVNVYSPPRSGETPLTPDLIDFQGFKGHALYLRKDYEIRTILEGLGEISGTISGDDNPVKLFNEKVREIGRKVVARGEVKPWMQILKEAYDQIGEAMDKKGFTGIPTGVSRLDRITGGWQRSDQIIIAGRPGMGKTTFLLHLILKALEAGKRVVLNTVEMTAHQLAQRLQSILSGVPTNKIRTGDLTEEELAKVWKATERLGAYKLTIFETNDFSTLRGLLLMEAQINGVDLFGLDYLQLMTDKNSRNPREQQVSEISRELKSLAKGQYLDCTNLILSQLSREVEKRANKRPILPDLRESGAIEQDADMVIFPYRPSYYDDVGSDELIIAKNRHGAVAVGKAAIKVEMDMPTATIKDTIDPVELPVNKDDDDDVPW